MSQKYNLTAIRTLLTDGFTDAELRRFCYDNPDFRPAYDELSGVTGKKAILDVLLEHADRKDLLEPLLEWAQRNAAAKYDRFKPYREGEQAGRVPAVPLLGTVPPPPAMLVGRDKQVAELRQRLTSPTEITLLTAVRGWPGVGKTTLAAALAHDPQLHQAFPDGLLWTALGPEPDLLFGLGEWLLALGEDPRQLTGVESRHKRLATVLSQKQMLLFIDDVWDAAHARLFQVGGPKCRSLITTRQPEVARSMGIPEEAIYLLPILSEEKSLELLRRLAPGAIDQDPEGTRQLVGELEGLPLALQVAGRLLAAEAAMGWGIGELLEELAEGRRILQEKAPADRSDVANQATPTVAVLLKQSTDRLDETSRERFALLGIFVSKPATFDAPAVSAAWDIEDPKPTLRLLVDRGLLEPAGDGRFQMHALLTVHARSMWEEGEDA